MTTVTMTDYAAMGGERRREFYEWLQTVAGVADASATYRVDINRSTVVLWRYDRNAAGLFYFNPDTGSAAELPPLSIDYCLPPPNWLGGST